MDFTLKKYEEFLSELSENKIRIYGIRDWIKLKPKNGILLRHDIDRKPKNGLKVALLEKKYGILSTYYFRIVKSSFNKSIIKQIVKLEHEIGYHYEDLSIEKGSYEKAILLFKKNLSKFRDITDIDTISMHGRPLSAYDNRDLWKEYDYKKFNLIGEAFLSIDYKDIFYFTDTGRTWRNSGANLRDKVNSNNQVNIKSTKELIDFINENRDKKIAIVSHPERWAKNNLEFIYILLKDTLINIIKRLLILFRAK